MVNFSLLRKNYGNELIGTHISLRPDRINDPSLNERKKLKIHFLNNIKTMTIMTLKIVHLNFFKKVLSLSLIFIIILRFF